MKITVCELPHGAHALERAWAALCAHTRQQRSELVVLPEFAFVEPVWTSDRFDAARWSSAESACGRRGRHRSAPSTWT